ncbi:hypothetical protein TNCV_2483661 [Trichonephila clavipes]|uniref:Uncharacterized protein n=1 Tax=Trichonephila clavipes TaxID=2585209 RepID=A0A8X7BAQ1_TRICX|nr:hypothetical protein TNCV_2483661 [Trichonephila clavipes]
MHVFVDDYTCTSQYSTDNEANRKLLNSSKIRKEKSLAITRRNESEIPIPLIKTNHTRMISPFLSFNLSLPCEIIPRISFNTEHLASESSACQLPTWIFLDQSPPESHRVKQNLPPPTIDREGLNSIKPSPNAHQNFIPPDRLLAAEGSKVTNYSHSNGRIFDADSVIINR